MVGERGCKIVKQWSLNHKINRLMWPAQSPDLNPIEHVWKHLQKSVAKHKCNNIPELKEKIVEEFNNIDKSFLNKLIESMNGRCKAVIKAKGGHIKY